MNEIKEAELDRLNRKITHYNRYLIIVDKMKQFTEEVGQRQHLEEVDHIKMNELCMEHSEAMMDMFNDLSEENEHLKNINNLSSNALRHYARTYGNHLISEQFPPENFTATVTILPLDEDMLTIDVKVVVIEDEHDD